MSLWKSIASKIPLFAAIGDTAHAGASSIRKQLRNWQPMRNEADADLLPDLGTLTARSRDLDRNNGVAAGAFQTLADNVVGIGLRLSAKPDYRALGRDITWAEEWSRQVESLWRSWAEDTCCDAANQMTFASMTQMVFRATLLNGDALALPLWMDDPRTQFRTKLQLIESDRLSNPQGDFPTQRLRGGIEMDAYGRPLAYYIRKTPAADTPLNVGAYYFATDAGWERIPAETEWGRKRVILVNDKGRTGQSRGKPILSSVIEQFRMLDSYQRTELQTAIVNALVAGVIETPVDMPTLLDMFGGDMNKYLECKNEYRTELEGGTFIPIYPGDKLTPFTPARPSGQFSAFVETIMRQIGTALGLPYELILKDFSKTNYSSARASLLQAWRFFMARRDWLATYWCDDVYALWLEEAVNLGLVEAPDYYAQRAYYLRAKWIGPGQGYVDPVKESQAAKERIANKTSTLEIECAAQGLDWEEVLEQLKLEQNRMEELGLDSMPPAQPQPPQFQQPQQAPPEEAIPA